MTNNQNNQQQNPEPQSINDKYPDFRWTLTGDLAAAELILASFFPIETDQARTLFNGIEAEIFGRQLNQYIKEQKEKEQNKENKIEQEDKEEVKESSQEKLVEESKGSQEQNLQPSAV